jgi:ABC-type polysaccharide/polyol phosphate transport system ATPase subunit
MSDDVLVKVDNVSKRFCRSLKRSLWYGLQDLGSEIGGRRHGGRSGLPQSSADVQLRPDEFWAVKDVSFELRRGECLGLIGRNGAGKTTLLRMLNGLIKPDTGRIEMRGEIGALIALGAGFNPVLTGRENIYISASVIGLSAADTKKRLDDIVSFSGIERFIDSPVQSYSSGMQVRLGFAVASSMAPDILVLDEVLAVGDREFQHKCFSRIGKMREQGCATILVSHNHHHLSRFCTKGALLENGRIKSLASIEECLQLYDQSDQQNNDFKTKKPAIIIDFDQGNSDRAITINSRINIKATLGEKSLSDFDILWLELVIRDPSGNLISYVNADICQSDISCKNGTNTINISFCLPKLFNTKLVPSFALWNASRTQCLATDAGNPLSMICPGPKLGMLQAFNISKNNIDAH